MSLLCKIQVVKNHLALALLEIKSHKIHEKIKPMSWLLGKWHGTGKGYYPNIDDFTYEEEVEFSHFGKPMLQYSAYSWNPEKKTPMHREVGFLRIKPDTNHVALMLAHNLGACDMEEGEFNGQELTLLTQTMANMSFDEHGVRKVCAVVVSNSSNGICHISLKALYSNTNAAICHLQSLASVIVVEQNVKSM
ncbi:hypothetical protein KUTeg_011766, partial [Tegillarca granosa]